MSVLPAILPHAAYTDKETFERERCQLFDRAWLYGGLAPADRQQEIGRCGGLTFAAKNPVSPLEDWLSPYGDWLATATAECGQAVATGHKSVACNWKLLAENTLDDCHAGTLHANSLQRSFPDWRHSLRLNRHGGNSDITLPLSDQDRDFWARIVPRLALRRFGESQDYRHVFLFPNTYVASFCDTMVLVHWIEPVDAARSILHWQMLLPTREPATGGKAALFRTVVAELAQQAGTVIDEDVAICELAQRGRYFAVHPGLLSEREVRIADFQERLVRAMDGHPNPSNP